MNILILGATGFIGTNLSLELSKTDDNLFLFGKKINDNYKALFDNKNVNFIEGNFDVDYNFVKLTYNIDIVYHLISQCIPANSNDDIAYNSTRDAVITCKLIEAMVKNKCKRIVFMSSGGAIYGNSDKLMNEMSYTNPITAYGIQKLLIEKYLYLYYLRYNLDYRVIRLGNPFGPYQFPGKGLGLISTLIYSGLYGRELNIYGNGNNKRDYIYISDAIKAIINISSDKSKDKLYNLGSGHSVSVNDIIYLVEKSLNTKLKINCIPQRETDVSNNYIDISKYISEFGKSSLTTLDDGINKTIIFFINNKDWFI